MQLFRIGQGNIMMRLTALLSVLVVLSFCVTSGMLARYATQRDTDGDARVAAFRVLAASSPDSVTVDCTTAGPNEGSFDLTVTNQSEVAVRYDIIVTLTQDLPAGVSAKIDGNAPTTVSVDQRTLTFKRVGDLAVGPASAVHTLLFSVDDFLAFTAPAVSEVYTSGELAFDVTVNFVQID